MNFGKLGQSFEHRRQDKFAITFGGSQNAAGNKIRGIFQYPDKITDFVQNIRGNSRSFITVGKKKDRHLMITAAQIEQNIAELARTLFIVFIIVEQNALQFGVGGYDCPGVKRRFRNDNLGIFSFQVAFQSPQRPGGGIVFLQPFVEHQYLNPQRIMFVIHAFSPLSVLMKHIGYAVNYLYPRVKAVVLITSDRNPEHGNQCQNGNNQRQMAHP